MTTEIFCSYCKHNWKLKRDYDKHINCCMYFNQLRKQPQEEMDDNGLKLPTIKELFRYVKDLSLRLEKTERELARVKSVVNTRQKKMIIEWLNQPNQTPLCTFEEWWSNILVNETHMKCVFDRDLTDGIKTSIGDYISNAAVGSNKSRPIRCFIQKPGVFYVYSKNGGTKEPLAEPQWRIMDNSQMEKMVIHIAQLFLRVFLEWQKQQQQTEDEENATDLSENSTDKIIMNMIKINGARTPDAKRVVDVKKWLFPKIEENLRIIMECEFE